MKTNSFIVEHHQESSLIYLTPLQPLRFEQWLQCKSWFAGTTISARELQYGADLVELQLRYADEAFTLHYEDYSESCWISADTAAAAMLLSELANLFRQLELTGS